MKTLHARASGAQFIEGTNTFVVAFAEREDGDGASFAIAANMSAFDERERRLGYDTYSVIVDAATTAYGGIDECVLDGTELTVRLSERVAAQLGVDRELVVTFAAADRAEIEAGLRQVFSRAKLPVRFSAT